MREVCNDKIMYEEHLLLIMTKIAWCLHKKFLDYLSD